MEKSVDHKKKEEEITLDFSGLILGFSSAALYHIGYQSEQKEQRGQQDFVLAKQNIDIIRMLQHKTKGNLDPNEKRLIADVLSDLEEKFNQAEQKK